MAEITPSSIRVDIAQVQFRAVANQSLINRLGAINNFIASNLVPTAIGTIVQSYLTQAQFQAVRGTGWVLCDGRNVVGSAYQTITGNSTVPDVRGTYLRGKNNGRSDGNQNPDGDLPLGTFQSDQILGHDHDNTLNHNTSAAAGGTATFTPPFSVVYGSQVGRNLTISLTGPVNVTPPHRGDSTPVAGTETRPVTVTANAFIRIN